MFVRFQRPFMIINAEIEALKLEKIRQAEDFFNYLGKDDLRFFGVAGSVSYAPNLADDVDIFIITERCKLWKILLKAFLARRRIGNQSLCISLTMDEEFAEELFSRDAEYVVASDAVHVIRIFGSAYYESLLSKSPFVERYFPNRIKGEGISPECSHSGIAPFLNFFIFLSLAPYLIFRSLRNSKKLSKINVERRFMARTGIHHFYLDSEKYRNLKLKKEELL